MIDCVRKIGGSSAEFFGCKILKRIYIEVRDPACSSLLSGGIGVTRLVGIGIWPGLVGLGRFVEVIGAGLGGFRSLVVVASLA